MKTTIKIYLLQVVGAVTEDGIESRFKLCGEFLNFMGKNDLLSHLMMKPFFTSCVV
jgi:hypothetical protein